MTAAHFAISLSMLARMAADVLPAADCRAIGHKLTLHVLGNFAFEKGTGNKY